jgi:hypothetical protein
MVKLIIRETEILIKTFFIAAFLFQKQWSSIFKVIKEGKCEAKVSKITGDDHK